jgi:hypothetical protein
VIGSTVIGANKTFISSGFYTTGDLGAGAMYTSVGAGPSGPMAIQDASGTWFQLVLNDFLTVGWCGAKGDGITDDTIAFQTGNDIAFAAGKALFIPSVSNAYLITDTVNISCRHVYGETYLLDSENLGTHILWTPTVRADMKPCFNVTGADGSCVYDINIDGPDGYSTSTLVSSGTVNPVLLPNYSAFADGLAGFGTSGAGKVTFIRCTAQYVKAALYMAGEQGHTFCDECIWGNGNTLFGVYNKINSEDYSFMRCGFNGAWAGVMWGTTPYAGHNGGFEASFIRCHFGAPYCFYQCDNAGIGASTAGGYDLILYDVSFEAIGEAIISVLDSDTSASYFIMPDRPGFSFNPNAGGQLPDAIIPAGQKQKYIFNFGNLRVLKLTDVVGAFFPSDANVNSKVARIYVDGSGTGQWDRLALLNNGPIDIINSDQNVDNLRNFPIIDWQHRQEKATRSGVLQTPNMLLNPEVPANWTTSNVTVTLSDYATLVGGALSTATFTRQFFEELGDNPTALVFTPSATPWNCQVPFNPNPTTVGKHCPALSYWTVKAGTEQQYRSRLDAAGFVFLYDNTYTIGTTVTKIWGVGFNSGGAGYINFSNSGSSTDVSYIFGLMVALDDLAQYNPTQGPSLIGMPFLQSQTTASSATAGAASVLPATPLGYLEVNLAGVLCKISYYSV